MIELDVPAEAAGARLDRFLAEPLGSRARAQSLIGSGRVRVDGAAQPKSHALSGGERISVEEADPPAPLPVTEVAYQVAYEDSHLLIVDKPAGLVVHPAPSHTGPTLVDLLGDLLGGGDPERPGIVHRLDRGTSGLLVVARGEEAHAALQAQVQRREVERVYLALAGGRLGSRTGTIDAPIGRASRQRHRMAVSGAASRQARTHFTVLELLPLESYLEARLETGRTHQIRAHFAAIGHPLTGDTTYGGTRRYGLERQFLHAHRLAFDHPFSGERLAFESELPDDLAGALEAARASP
jgi:23S rRNA pseudouridine1911/1915/1917 synthase